MAEATLKIEGLQKNFGGVTAADNIFLEIEEGQIHAVIGPNGAGKTTLVSLLSGMTAADAGRIIFNGRDISGESPHARSLLGLARSFQITSLFKAFSARENVALAIQAHQGHSFRFWRAAANDRDLMEPAQAFLDDVGIGRRADVIAGNLAHGEQRQLEIAMALATRPKLLLLDEPTAGMGTEESEVMRDFLARLKGTCTMLLIEHDMDTVFALADQVTVLVYGRVIATGTPEEIRKNDEVRAAYLGEEEDAAGASRQ